MSQVGLDTFPDAVRRDVEGLEILGVIEDTLRMWGHSFTMRTLTGEEELAASIVTKEYVETLGQAKSWAWANVALALQEVDGNPNFCARLGPDPVEFARTRFRFCTSKWQWIICEELFGFYVSLQQRQVAAMDAMRDFSERSQPTSSPALGSLNDLGISNDDLAPDEG